MSDTKVKDKPVRQVPILKWSNHSTRPYSGISIDGWTGGEGYVTQSIMICRRPRDYHNNDLKKAIRVLRACGNRNLYNLSNACQHELDSRSA